MGNAVADPARDGTPSTFAYQPALDGVRAVAVGLVLLFHGGVAWLSGGYLGVSVFFTLSGYLITALLVREVASTGSVRVGSFYARRARRLLPASVACLAGIVVGARLDLYEGVAHLRRDLLGALFQVANWVQLFAGESYGDLLQAQGGARSPLDHYWSLAIEEQFYWVWPLAVGWLARRRLPGGWSTTLGAATVAAGVAAPVIAWAWGPDAAYWATPARAAEILAGATLACLAFEGRAPRVPVWLAGASLVAIVGLSTVLPADGGFAYHGGLPLVALLSSGLIHGLQAPGAVRTLLSTAPLVALGRISYGVYLYHWPIYAVVDEEGTGWHGARLLAVRLVATLVVATVSYVVLESPVRRARWRPSRTGLYALPAVAVVAVATVVVVPELSTDYGADAEVAAEAAIQPVSADLPPLTLDGGVPSRPLRLVLTGDSTAMALGAGLTEWAAEHPDRLQVNVPGELGCGFMRSGEFTDGFFWSDVCERFFDSLPGLLTELQPDVVALLVWLADIAPRTFDGGPEMTPTDPEYRALLERDYRAVTDLILSTTEADVVWVRPPLATVWWDGDYEQHNPADGRAVLDAVIADLVAEHPDRVQVIDMNAHFEASGIAQDRDLRPDGMHLNAEGGRRVAEEWLVPTLTEIAADRPPD